LPDLQQSLQGRDLGHLRIVALLWGVDLDAPDARVGLQRLAVLLLDRGLLAETIQTLPERAREALDTLLEQDGRMPWGHFTRRYGQLREIGPARRDRERPYENASASASEALWYRALIGRGFFDTANGPEEYAFIPEDLLALMPAVQPVGKQPLGRPASPAERAYVIPASDRILDDACTLLAALRIAVAPRKVYLAAPAGQGGVEDWFVSAGLGPYTLTPAMLEALLALELLDAGGAPLPEPARAFLAAGRGEALAMLFRTWLRSLDFNELLMLPGLAAEGDWRNDPLRARQAVLDFLFTVPGSLLPSGGQGERPFWSLTAFVAAIRQTSPDFQRPAGDYDSWYLRSSSGGEFLRGFEHWEDVDGALVRFMIAGPLHWLGILDLAMPAAPAAGQVLPVTAFRFSQWAADLLNFKAPQGLGEESESISVAMDGTLRVPRRAPRSARYQAARFAAWEKVAQDVYLYRLSPQSLEAARQQGLRVQHLLALLRRYAQAVPPSLVKALERWEAHGSQARLERVTILRVKDPDLLQSLRASRLARFLGEPLGQTAVMVKPGAVEKILAGLAEEGYLGEVQMDG
jgi:hypothetical protein